MARPELANVTIRTGAHGAHLYADGKIIGRLCSADFGAGPMTARLVVDVSTRNLTSETPPEKVVAQIERECDGLEDRLAELEKGSAKLRDFGKALEGLEGIPTLATVELVKESEARTLDAVTRAIRQTAYERG